MEYKSGLRNEQYVKTNKKKMTKEEVKKYFAAQKEKDSELIPGIFQNMENPRGTLVCSIKLYDDPPVEYDLTDGERYSLPRGVVRHLNNNCWYPEYKHVNGQQGTTGMRGANNAGIPGTNNWQVMTKVYRYRFNRVDFGDDYDLNPSDIAQVQATL